MVTMDLFDVLAICGSCITYTTFRLAGRTFKFITLQQSIEDSVSNFNLEKIQLKIRSNVWCYGFDCKQ